MFMQVTRMRSRTECRTDLYNHKILAFDLLFIAHPDCVRNIHTVGFSINMRYSGLKIPTFNVNLNTRQSYWKYTSIQDIVTDRDSIPRSSKNIHTYLKHNKTTEMASLPSPPSLTMPEIYVTKWCTPTASKFKPKQSRRTRKNKVYYPKKPSS